MPTGVVYTYDNAGKLIKMEGYSDAGIKQWANLYDAANGRLTEQRGFYGSGALSQSIIVHVDGSKSATFFEASGRIFEQDEFAADGNITYSKQTFADNSTQITTLSGGKPTSQIGYDPQNRKSYENIFGAGGKLIEQDGFNASGVRTIAIIYNGDNTRTVKQWTDAGKLREQDEYDASGNIAKVTQIAADGSWLVSVISNNKTVTQDGFDAAGKRTYSNVYNGSGVLTEQYGYTNGARTAAIIKNADGTTTDTRWNVSGALTAEYRTAADGKPIQSITYAADGSYQKNLFTGGVLASGAGYNAAGIKQWENIYAGGVLVEQGGYAANGTRTLQIQISGDGSIIQKTWDSAGKLLQEDHRTAGGVSLWSVVYAADNSYVVTTRDANGKLIEIDGFYAGGGKTFVNHYTNGVLTEQLGYAANGAQTVLLQIASDGSVQQKNWDDSGKLLKIEMRNAAGVAVNIVTYAADGSYTVVVKDAVGHLIESAGYTAAGIAVFHNYYDVTGLLYEQRGYHADGHIAVIITHAADGTGGKTVYNTAGSITEIDVLNAAGVSTKTTLYNATGSTVTLRTDAGNVKQIDGYDAAGHHLYVNMYDSASGKLLSQSSYYADGGPKSSYVLHTDGTATQTFYDQGGTAHTIEQYDATGHLVHSTSPGLGDATYVFWSGASVAPAIDKTGFLLTFADEFNSLSAGPQVGSTWKTTMAYGDRKFGSTGEVQYYSDTSTGVNPFSISNGVLDITAKVAAPGDTPAASGATWTSGVLSTDSSFAQQYGYYEVRMRMPTGAGMWPAFWMLPAGGGWPPELDIVEAIGKSATTIYGSTHAGTPDDKTTIANTMTVQDISAAFHVYGLNWGPTTITWYIDGVAVATQATPDDLHRPMYMMLNLAVGGELSWPGPTDGSITSATMSIDYVRVYQTGDTVIAGVDRTGSAANPNIVGFAGNDHFVLAAGTVSADGGLGVNKAEIATAWTDAKWKPLAGGAWQLTTGLGQMSLTNIAEVNFQGLTIRLGTDKTLVGVDSFGSVFWTDTFAADGTSVVQWYSANRHIEEDLVNAAGIVVRQTLFAQDGSTTILQFTDDGHKTAQRGYSAGALPTYANYYDAGTGRLIQQDGYNSGGSRIQTQFFAADGSSIVDKYTAAGVLIEHDVINAAGIYISAKLIAGDGSYTLTLRSATGAVTEIGGYTAAGKHTYLNSYSATTGQLLEQDGYDAAGNKTSVQLYAADGSSTLTQTDANGVVNAEYAITAGGVYTFSKVYAGDRSYTIAQATAAGVLTKFDGYTASGGHIYGNSYNSTTGALIQQDGYHANGVKSSEQIFAADHSSTLKYWNASGVLIEDDIVNAGGVRISSSVYPGDGSHITTLRTASGAVYEIDGYTTANVKQYSNFYDPGTGRLTEADGFHSNGTRISQQIFATDDSSTLKCWNSAGTLTESDLINASGVKISESLYPGDGSHTTALRTASGALYQFDGYTTAGWKQYSNIYDPAANRLIEADGFDSAGHKIQVTLFAADGTYNVAAYTTGGTMTTTTYFSASNVKTADTVQNGASYVAKGYVNGAVITGTPVNDTFTGGGNNQKFVFAGTVGVDTITNFHAGSGATHDVIAIDHNIFANYSSLLSHTHDVGGSAQIQIDASNMITLSGVSTASLVSADFIFV